MNVKLLEQVKRSILAHPKRFVMDSFIEAKKLTGEDFFFADDGTEVKFDHCGTAACVAGYTCLIKMKQKAINAELNFHVSGMDYLGLDGDEAYRSIPSPGLVSSITAIMQPALRPSELRLLPPVSTTSLLLKEGSSHDRTPL
jgi:hypothetical protein